MKEARAKILLAHQLGRQVLASLTGGGGIEPLPPVGSARAIAAVEDELPLPDEVAPRIRLARHRVACRLCPLDRLPELGRAEWLMGLALNDLLQATNPDLVGVLGRDRPRRLIEMAHQMLDAAGAPATIGEALARHGTFSRLGEVRRIDTTVSWWVGSATFRGQHPPARLSVWPELRRVRSQEEAVNLAAMPPAEAAWRDEWLACLARLYAASPLTDLAAVTRTAPTFQWTGASLGLTRSPLGRRLALRAVERSAEPRRAVGALAEAARDVGTGPARNHAEGFAAELESILHART